MWKYLFGGGSSSGGDGADGQKPRAPLRPAPLDLSVPDEKFVGGFDPRALERAAKAAKELEGNNFAKDAIELSRQAEKTAQMRSQADVEENKARQATLAVELKRVAEDERRKTIDFEQRAAQQSAQYQDQINRKRYQDELAAHAQMRAQELKRQEESALKLEQLRRETAAYEAQLRKETDAARADAEAKGRTAQERANFDLALERTRVEAKEMRETVLEAVQQSGRIVGDGLRAFTSDWSRMGTTISALSLLALGVYSARTGAGVAGRFVEARLGKPPLVRETSRRSPFAAMLHPVATARRLFAPMGNALEGVVLEPNLASRLSGLATSTLNTRKNNAPFRHVLLHGPPGTGKTLFAKKLARTSGMDYAVLSGGDVAPLGRDAVTEVHRLFDWSATSSRGLLVFVDEADAFLRKRTNASMSEDARNALNAFLYRTGTESRAFMLVLATNVPEQLDFAVLDRADEAVEFTLPGVAERREMLKLYVDKYIANPDQDRSLLQRRMAKITSHLDENKSATIVRKTQGFSGREIAKLVIALQAAALGTADAVLTEEIIDRVLDEHVQQHITKHRWLTAVEAADAGVTTAAATTTATTTKAAA